MIHREVDEVAEAKEADPAPETRLRWRWGVAKAEIVRETDGGGRKTCGGHNGRDCGGARVAAGVIRVGAGVETVAAEINRVVAAGIERGTDLR